METLGLIIGLVFTIWMVIGFVNWLWEWWRGKGDVHWWEKPRRRKWLLTNDELRDLATPQEDDEPAPGYIRRTQILYRFRFRARVLKFCGLGIFFLGIIIFGLGGSHGLWLLQLLGAVVCIFGLWVTTDAASAETDIQRAMRSLGVDDGLN